LGKTLVLLKSFSQLSKKSVLNEKKTKKNKVTKKEGIHKFLTQAQKKLQKKGR